MLTAWDMNNRSPRFFTKWSNEHLKDNLYDGKVKLTESTLEIDKVVQDYSMTVDKMAVCSAASPWYFSPAEVNGNFYISGDNIAASPAMQAFLHANEKLGKDATDIRVVSVGAANVLPEKIDKTTSLLDWVTKLLSLMSPIKKHTQDYMLGAFLHQGGHHLRKFQLYLSKYEDYKMFMSSDRLP